MNVVFVVDRYPSHVFASLGLARKLIRLGCAVEYWGSDDTAVRVQEQGLRCRSVAEIWGRRPRFVADAPELRWPERVRAELVARRSWADALRRALPRLECAIDRLVEEARPELFVFDPFLLAYAPLLLRRGLPVVALSTKPLAVPDPLVPSQTSSLIPSRTRRGRFRLRLSRRAARLRCGLAERGDSLYGALGGLTHRRLVETIAAHAGFPLAAERVERHVPLDLCFRSLPEWALWTPDMDFPRQDPLPSNARYIGPCVDRERRSPGTKRSWKRGARPLVYVSLGLAERRNKAAFLGRVVRAFAGDPTLDLLIATGDRDTTTALCPCPDNVLVHDQVPQLEVLEQADLAITHGGAGTLRECIDRGVPMLVYPRAFDQFGNGARVVFHGLGLRGDRRRDDAGTIRRQALAIIDDDGYRARLRAMREKVARFESQVDLTGLVRDAVAGRRAIGAGRV